MASVQAMNDNSGFRVTGRIVLFSLFGFFALIFAANAILIWLAVSTNTGVAVSSSYQAGGNYQSELDAAKAQAARNWSVSADIVRSGDGAAIDITVRDTNGAPIGGLDLTVSLASVASEADDRLATLSEGEVGRYRGTVDTLAPGKWLLIIDAMQGEDRVYRSENRVSLK